jgi:hypothetical protein
MAIDTEQRAPAGPENGEFSRAEPDRARHLQDARRANAIVYSSGLLPITRMIKAGAVFDIIGAVLCVAGVIAMANLVGVA